MATSSFPADSALASMMQDDRLARTIDRLEEDILVEVQYVHTLSDKIWELLGRRCLWDGVSLRSASMSSALTSASFIMWRLQYLHELPWTLVQGDVEANLDNLVAVSRRCNSIVCNGSDLSTSPVASATSSSCVVWRAIGHEMVGELPLMFRSL